MALPMILRRFRDNKASDTSKNATEKGGEHHSLDEMCFLQVMFIK